MHPYAIRQEIIEATGQRYFPRASTIKSALTSLENSSLLEESNEGNYWLKARKSVPYQLTLAGRKLLDRELAMYMRVIDTAKTWELLQKSYAKARGGF